MRTERTPAERSMDDLNRTLRQLLEVKNPTPVQIREIRAVNKRLTAARRVVRQMREELK